ncbi:MAG TPA: CrcB family protein [Paracoccaceae bacterium]|nr:CrcB family protein [Paracoccaceae bacterium]
MKQAEEAASERPASPVRVARPKGQPRRRLREGALLYLAVALGSSLGGVARAVASLAALAWLGPGFPWGTLAVNVLGSFVIGFYATLTGPGGRIMAGTHLRQFVMTGFCGGFTTFSIFSLETLGLAREGRPALAAFYVGVSVVTWLAAAWLGHMIAARINRLGGI